MPKAEQPEKPAATTVAEETRIPEETLIPETDDIGPEDTPEEPATDNRPAVQESSPFVPQTSTEKPAVQVNLGTGGAIAAGGGLLAALATQLARADVSALIPGNHAIDGPGSPNSNAIDGPNSTSGLETTHSHRMPLVVGLSVKFPVTEKIGVTTGLDTRSILLRSRILPGKRPNSSIIWASRSGWTGPLSQVDGWTLIWAQG